MLKMLKTLGTNGMHLQEDFGYFIFEADLRNSED